ncbi:ABC transporter permease [Sansalvadorimonas verongulae]|uniref:ABC transporter permease n=1 Tax=Sansalvadorimonas verongulae TaxID=2172824 RepID=UPI0012BBAC9C|nr:ABC transporter permease [Sansalvadorimonas verongulae]MTI14568.1 ABC transporter permease [Sansalvadorimonas verongulae]
MSAVSNHNQSKPGYTLAYSIALIFPAITIAGFAGVSLPAFGWFPALGFESFSLTPWQTLMTTPGLWEMVLTTLFVGLTATALSLLLTCIFAISCWQTRIWSITSKALAPLLAIPHSALAIGVLFLLAPSGLFSRLLAGPLDWARPPDVLSVNDPLGLSLIVTLVLKEAPFLCLMLMSAVSQTPVRRLVLAGRSLGYTTAQSWLKLAWPQIYPKIRLPVFIVLAFSLSVVDVSLIIGPNLPPLLPVQVLFWQQDPEASLYLLAAAGSLLLLGIVLTGAGMWLGAEAALKRYLRTWMTAGYRGHRNPVLVHAGRSTWIVMLFMALATLVVVSLWTVAWRWRFPNILPSVWSLKSWLDDFPRLIDPLMTTLVIAFASAVIGIVLSVMCLEFRPTHKPWKMRLMTAFFYLPLLLPQMTFLLGIQAFLVSFHWDGTLTAVIACHLLFVFPYCYLSLAGSWEQYDQRYSHVGKLLCGCPWKTFWQVKIPILLTPLMTTLALGIAVSTALYLPTLMAGAGRFETLTTEAVALATGGNRRLLALYALMQMLIPMLFFALALLTPKWSQLKHRKDSSVPASGRTPLYEP